MRRCMRIATFLCSVLGVRGALERVQASLPFSVRVGCNASTPYVFPIASTPTVVFTVPLSNAAAEFIAFNITFFHLPPSDYIQVRTVNTTAPVYTYRGWYPRGFVTTPLFSTNVVLELVSFGSTNSNCDYGLEISSYQYSATPPTRESACDTTNDAPSPSCDQRPTSPYWRGARGVARLLINGGDGAKWCTGWLLGCENHVLTNYHCIATEADAKATTFDFRAFGRCGDNCLGGGKCSTGNVVVGSTLVASSEALDYALVKLDSATNWSAGNFLRLQPTVVVGDPIYIPQHALGGGMTVAIKAYEGRFGLVQTSTYSNDDCGLGGMIGYKLNTLPGSSGSPVISSISNAVVAVHSCGGCAIGSGMSMNGGIPSAWIIQDLQLKNALPQCAVAAPAEDGLADYTAVHGTLLRRSRGVSIDVHKITFAYDGVVTLDVLAFEKAADGSFSDIDGDCDASYFDSKLYLMSSDGAILAVNEDSVHGNGRSDGSISDRDAFLTFSVEPGTYYILVGTTDMTDIDAIVAVGSKDKTYAAGDLFVCGIPRAQYAHYTLTIQTNMDADSVIAFEPSSSQIPPSCIKSGEVTKPYKFCPYHEEAPLSLKYLVDGTIHQTNDTISIDHITFELVKPAHIGLEVVSYQSLDNGTLLPNGFDEFGLCGRSYIDAVVHIFEDTTNNHLQLIDISKLIVTVDDKPPGISTPSGTSVSPRDPFVDLYLPPGKYIAAIGQYPLSVHESVLTSTGSKAGFSPRLAGSPSTRGNYHIMFTSAVDGALLAPSMPVSYVEEPCVAGL